MTDSPAPRLAVLAPGQPFPPLKAAWPAASPAPGLLAAGGTLDTGTLLRAYSRGIFPWFGEGEPILWWSPDPRMVLDVVRFRLHRSLRQVLVRFRRAAGCEVRIDSAFERVVAACAGAPRAGQQGTWIGPQMRRAYAALHHAGHAHSVETWIDGRLVAGLYCVAIGRAVFGESMFTHVSDGSKVALSALVAFCRAGGLPLIDCQQNTGHLAFMGAAEMPRAVFAARVAELVAKPAPAWKFEPVYWSELMPQPPAEQR